MKKLLNQKGIIQTLPLLIIIVAVGIISFLLITSAAPFKGGLLGDLNPKTASQAMAMSMMDGCMFLNPDGTQNMSITPAFCDTFATPMPGGRGGDLDETKWEYARSTNVVNPSQGMLYSFWPGPAQFCKNIIQNVVPDNDSFVCGAQFGEPNHWMESFNDGGNYVYDSAKARQPFDFTDRTGIITFNVDAKTEGSHTWWPEIVISDTPVVGAHHDAPGVSPIPANGIGFQFGNTSCSSTQYNGGFPEIKTIDDYTTVGKGGLDTIEFIKNYVGTEINGTTYSNPGGCYTTQTDNPNHFEIKISLHRIELWGSDIGGANFRLLDVLTKMPDGSQLTIPFTRGYVNFGHADYNAGKENVSSTMTYHWHGLGFDGPVLPMLRGYDVPDSLKLWDPTRGPGVVNIGYYLNTSQTKSFTLQNVDLSNVTDGHLNMTYTCDGGVAGLQYRFNGVTWRNAASSNPRQLDGGCPVAISLLIPVVLSDLKQGINTLELKTVNAGAAIANIGLELTPTTVSSTTSPMPSMSSTPGCTKVGDINCDNLVNIFDYNIEVGNFGKTVTPNTNGDLDGDGKVGIFDFNILIGNFGK